MQIKITQEGFENFTGFVGNVEFHDGVSVGHVSKLEAETLAALYTVAEVVEGEDVKADVEKIEKDADAEEKAEEQTEEQAGEQEPTEAAE